MAHIWVTVCLPPDAEHDLADSLTRALAPFEMYCGYGKREMWDYWRVRGGGEGLGFQIRPGYAGDPRLIHDWPRNDGFVLPSSPGECTGGPKGLLNLAADQGISWVDLLTLDGWWVEPNGAEGYAGCDHDDRCEHDAQCPVPPGGNAAYLEGLPYDAVLVRVYCHG